MNNSVNRLTSGDLRNLAYGMDPKAQKTGRGFICRCPAHDDRNPSLSIALGRQGQLLLYCNAGCTFEDVMDELVQRGLLESYTSAFGESSQQGLHYACGEQLRQSKICTARELWGKSLPLQGTVAETYLRSRLGHYLTSIPRALRYLHACKHPSGSVYPCMIAEVTHCPHNTTQAVHRTFLRHDGMGKAEVEPSKMLLGHANGGAVRLATATEELILCEGIEDGLTLQSIIKKPVWVAGSASFLKSIVLPALPLAATVYIAHDNDRAGREARDVLGNRLAGEGRKVKIQTPPSPYKDFNELVLKELTASPLTESALNSSERNSR